MNELQFRKLRVGDSIVNKRNPGIVLKVVEEANPDERASLAKITVRAPHGDFVIDELRHSEFTQVLKQIPLDLP